MLRDKVGAPKINCRKSPHDSDEGAGQAAAPVTIKLSLRGSLTPEELERYIVKPVKEKYPNITVQIIDSLAKGHSLAELVAGNDIPDIVIDDILNSSPYIDLGLGYTWRN